MPNLIEEKTFKMEEFTGEDGYAVIIQDKNTNEIIIGVKNSQDDSIRLKLYGDQAQLMGDVLKDWANIKLKGETEDQFKMRKYFEHLKEFASLIKQMEGVMIPYHVAKEMPYIHRTVMWVKDELMGCWNFEREEYNKKIEEEKQGSEANDD